MTAEVAIMNQHALVLAADSAATVTMWVQGERQTRYFKGANKLYQLSKSHPVALMIYGSASLGEVPWELIVNEFRKVLGSEGYVRSSDYARHFLEFVKAHQGLFPDQTRLKAFNDKVKQAAYRALVAILEVHEVKGADRNNGPVFQSILCKHLQLRVEALRNCAPQELITPADVESAVAAHIESATGFMTEVSYFGNWRRPLCPPSKIPP